MESVEFYAELLYKSRQLGGPKEFTPEQVEQLYEIRRQFGLPGKHPANVCPNVKAGQPRCPSCGGNCHGSANTETDAVVAEITKRVMEQLNLR